MVPCFQTLSPTTYAEETPVPFFAGPYPTGRASMVGASFVDRFPFKGLQIGPCYVSRQNSSNRGLTADSGGIGACGVAANGVCLFGNYRRLSNTVAGGIGKCAG
jgi:hypothetical protein